MKSQNSMPLQGDQDQSSSHIPMTLNEFDQDEYNLRPYNRR